MHTATQVLAHRAQPATRTKARWQPYNSTTILAARSPATIHLHTLKPSVPSPQPPPTVTPKNPPSAPSISTHSLKEPIQRDASKQKFALGLIGAWIPNLALVWPHDLRIGAQLPDQAVKTLSEIWRPQDIPTVFLGPSKGSNPPFSGPMQNCQPPTTPSQLVSTGSDSDNALLPLKNFVHEVLKRSRTSGSVLQTALCYLEAVRPQIPEIRRDDTLGIKSYFLPDSAILPATEAEIQMDQELSTLEASQPFSPVDEFVKTVRVSDHDSEGPDFSQADMDTSDASSVLAEPALSTISCATTTLPSPLLCPRRTFLAALILASKFSQDKCYSNRAWAKLSSLPPREIGRCERALGQALDWRLWVGKSPAGPQTLTATSGTAVRTVVRCQSESSIASPSSSRVPFLQPAEASSSATSVGAEAAATAPADVLSKAAALGRGLRKCSTLPCMGAPGQLPTLSATTFDNVNPPCSGQRMDGIRSNDQIYTSNTQYPTPTQPSRYAPSEAGSSESGSSPDTPPQSTPGDRTIQVAQFEEGYFSAYGSSQSWIDASESQYGAMRTASPASFLPAKAPATPSVFIASQLALDMAQMQVHLSSMADPSGIPYGPQFSGPGPYLWHADGLESARVF
jgi:hypothetical protein